MKADIGRDILIEAENLQLRGFLGLPREAEGVVLFAHGSGSGRFSPRNQFVAGVLQQAGLATLLIDLLEDWESDDRRKVFDIDLLSKRLLIATDWLSQNPETSALNIGYFGASTGAAAALQAAAARGSEIGAVVSRGGRPDLARDYLANVTAPTLLIVGGNDYPVISMNEEAYALITTTKKLVIVPKASHLFEEPGTLEQVADLATDWFSEYLQID